MTSTADAFDQPSPPEAVQRQPPGATDALPVIAAEPPVADALDRDAAAALLAEVALHRRARTPLALGVFGPAGSGKSRFLSAIAGIAERLATAASHGGARPGPFVGRVVTARIEAVPGREPAGQIVAGVLEALSADHAGFAEDAVHAGGDPREAARLAGERVNALRRSLDAERQTLDELGTRRARLTETVLFEGAGSRLDAYARANRARIENRLRAFGLPATDPIRSFKELVRDGAESSGTSRLGLTLRAIWGYKGQGTLIALAVVLAALGWAAGSAAEDPAPLSDWLAGFGDHFAAVTDWARAHLDLLAPVSHIALALAALSVLALAVRAARFLSPLLRGIALLRGDLSARRRDLDGLLAHQTRRVDGLAAEAEAAGRGAEAAQRRADGRRGTGLSDHGSTLAAELFGLVRTPDVAAEHFFARLGDAMASGGEGTPERLIVMLDGLDRLSPAEFAGLLGTAHRLLARPNIVTMVALERDAAAAALGEFDPAGAAARLDRMVQLSYDLGPVLPDPGLLAGRLLDPDRGASLGAPDLDPSRSALDRPFDAAETALVKRLAPFTGGTPRAIERFVDTYRVARADPRLDRAAPASLAMVALGLALDGTAAGSEVALFDERLGRGEVAVEPGSDLGRAFATVGSVLGTDARAGDLRRGLAVARSYKRRG